MRPSPQDRAALRFFVEIATAALRDEIALRLFDPLQHGARVIKQNPKRSVFALHDALLGPLIVKHHRIEGVRESVATRFLKSRAEREILTATALRALAIRTPEPVALFTDVARGFALSVTRAVPDATPLGTYLEQRFRPGDGLTAEKRRMLALAIDALVAIHRAGFDHRDFHGGNLLVDRDDGLFVIDLHRVGKGSPSARRRLRALADLLHTLRFALDPDDSDFALAEYARLSGGSFVPDTKAMRERLRATIDRRERARLRSRSKRCLVESSGFARILRGGCRGFRRREAPEADLFAAIASAREQIANGGPLLRSLSRRSDVAIGEAPLRRYAVKVYRNDGRRSVRGKMTGGRGKRAWRAANGLLVRGVPVARPIAWIQTPDRSVVVCDEIEDGVPLHVLAFSFEPGAITAQARSVALAVFTLTSRLFAANAQVNDLSPKNVLVVTNADGSSSATLCDFDGVRLKKPSRDRMIAALAQLNDLSANVPTRLRLLVLRLLKRRLPALGRNGTARRIAALTALRSARRLEPVPKGAISARAT